MKSFIKARITTNGTITVVDKSVAITQILIAVANAGTAWQLQIRDRASPNPYILVYVNLSFPATIDWRVQHFDEPIHMQDGIAIGTLGTTPGEVSIWINFEKGGGGGDV
jgi:hypothetical protein